ncbi:MAG: restriction endonuclease subunit S [Limnochordia bacterium]|jgi:type I restriction enzyme S subunit
MKSEWKRTRLKNFVEFNPRESLAKGTIAKKVTMGDLVEKTRKVRGFHMAEYKGGTLFRNGDTLFARITPSLENGKIAQVDILADNEIGFGSTEFIVWRAVDGVSDPGFVYYLANYRPIVETAIRSMSGTSGRQRVQLDVLKDFVCPVPTLRTQKAIADTLSCLDAKIDLNNRMNENLEKQAQAIFKSWFVDFEPFRDGEFVDSIIGSIPKGWKACAVTDVIDVNPKRRLAKGSVATYLSMANVATSGPRVLAWEQRKFTSGTCFMNGDVLLARITPSLEHGKTAFVDFLADQEVGWGSTEFIVMRSREPLPLEYTYCLAKHEPFREHMIKSMTGTSGRQRAQVDALKHYFLAIAPEDVYAEFEDIVRPMFLAIRRNGTENQVLAALRDTLLPKLMSGEIEVPVV